MLKEFYRLSHDTNYSPTNAIEEIFIKLIDIVMWIALISIGLYVYYVVRNDSILTYFSFEANLTSKTLALLLIIPFVYAISLIIGPMALLIGISKDIKKYNNGIEKIYIEIQEIQKKIK